MDFELMGERIRNSYRYITKRKNPDMEDDCVQECLLKFWQNGKGQTVDQAVIDFLRTQSGRKGEPGYEAKLSLQNAVELPDSLSYESKAVEINVTDDLDGRMKYICDLYCEGYTFREISVYLGVTESRVSQMFKDFSEKMQIILLLPKETRKWVMHHAF
jgi:DNA-directed RNA polymerase specialized sigma24 family protein